MAYTTKEIITTISSQIKENIPSLLKYKSFDIWDNDFRNNEEALKKLFPKEVHVNFPLHDDVVKLIIKELHSVMPFSKPYIINNYEKELNGIQYLLFPSQKADRLVILFSGLSGHKTYNRYSWYWDETEKWETNTVYLFLNDLSEKWYVGNDMNPMREKYIEIIQLILTTFSIERSNTFTIGGSMGGYAAILYAIDMGLRGAIAIHPQVSYKSARKHKSNDWEMKIRKCDAQFYDLTDFIFKRDKTPFMYLEYGLYEADREGAEELIRALQQREAFVVFRKTNNIGHVTNNPSKKTIESIIQLFLHTGFNDDYIK